MALAVFGALFVLLFVAFAIAQGIGRPSVPEGDVALVEDVPEGTVSEAEFRRAMVQQLASQGLKKIPNEETTRYEEMRKAALSELLDFIWLRGQAEEMGLRATKKLIDEELERIKEQNFPTPAAFKEFLKTSKLTRADVDKRVELQVLSNQITEAVQKKVGEPSQGEIEEYYEAAKSTQFTTKPSRDIRVITNSDKKKIEAAKAALEKDNSPARWAKLAKRYSEDPSTKSKGGLQEGLTEELLATAGPLKRAVFDAAVKELVGPVEFQDKWTVLMVVKLNPEKVQTLEEAETQISSTLQQQMQEEFFQGFVANYQSKWESRTICAPGFEVERCSNYKGDGRPSTANPACFEANPKTPATECPSVVTPISPALPGTVTILQPKGEQRPQRPIPAAPAPAPGE